MEDEEQEVIRQVIIQGINYSVTLKSNVKEEHIDFLIDRALMIYNTIDGGESKEGDVA